MKAKLGVAGFVLFVIVFLLAGRLDEPRPAAQPQEQVVGPKPAWQRQQAGTAPSPRPQIPVAQLPAILRTEDAHRVLGEDEGASLNTQEYFANTRDKSALLAASARVTVGTLGCLRTGGCDEVAPEDRPYFDPEKTPAQRLLAQALRLMVEGANAGMSIAPGINEADLLTAMERGNEESRLLALELLVQRAELSTSGVDPELFERVVAEKVRFAGEEAPLFFAQLDDLAGYHPELRASYLAALEDSFAHADASTVLELIRHIEDLKLNERDYTRCLRAVCRFTARSYPRATWQAISHHLDHYGNTQGFQTRPAQVCRT